MRDRTADPKRVGRYGVVVWQCDRYPEDGTDWHGLEGGEGRGGEAQEAHPI